jgi:cob(I)alamin adenosyltransferase
MVYNPNMPGFYTRKGDSGYTGVLGEGRLPKNHPRLDAIGSVDEATAAIGVARSQAVTPGLNNILVMIQRDLYHLMAEIAATPENVQKFRVIDTERVKWLEDQIDFLGASIDMPKDFIVPGDSQSGAAFALARTLVRRAERRVSQLFHDNQIDNPELLRYLNRLSSFCFILELSENQNAGIAFPTLASSQEQE